MREAPNSRLVDDPEITDGLITGNNILDAGDD
jgi:hypothetical protein